MYKNIFMYISTEPRFDSFGSKHHLKMKILGFFWLRSPWCHVSRFTKDQFPLNVHRRPNFSNLSWSSAPLSWHDWHPRRPWRPLRTIHYQRRLVPLGTWESDWRFKILICHEARHRGTRVLVHCHICCSSPKIICMCNQILLCSDKEVNWRTVPCKLRVSLQLLWQNLCGKFD